MISIDTRTGTASHPNFSHGNTLPLTGVPFGMNYLAVQTAGENGAWFFDPESRNYQGIRLTHQPSPWIGDFQHCLFNAVPQGSHDATGVYQPDAATFSPALINIFDEHHQVRTQATATARGGSLRFTSHAETLDLQMNAPDRWQVLRHDENSIVLQLQNFAASEDSNFSMYLALGTDAQIDWSAATVLLDKTQSGPFTTPVTAGGTLILPGTNDGPTTVWFATSFISPEFAQRELAKLRPQSFFSLAQANQTTWDDKMAIFQVQDRHADQVQTFYTNWYRALLYPMRFYERDEQGSPVHYSTIKQTVLPGRLYTNTGFWDTYKTSFPLYALVLPEQYGYFLEGFLNSAKETGYLPKWLSPDERGMMPGTMADAVVADAVTKGIRPDLWPELLAAMVHGATVPSPDGKYGRPNLKDYHTYGYLPADIHESVNQTLDYAYSDALIGVVAKALGKNDLAEKYTKAGHNYRHLFDPQYGLMHPKDRSGRFVPDFDPFTWGTGFTEGSAWQNSFAVYQDIPGLINLAGGPQPFLRTLHALANAAPQFNVGTYGGVIHEMAEMSALSFGQIAISNQPSFHIPYLFALAGEKSATELIVKQLLLHVFNAGPAGFPGDEDNGSMSSWYLWSALGLYPVRPGFDDYVWGIPLFDEVTIQLPDHALNLTTENNADYLLFVKERIADGQPIDQATITHQELIKTTQLTTNLSLLPSL